MRCTRCDMPGLLFTHDALCHTCYGDELARRRTIHERIEAWKRSLDGVQWKAQLEAAKNRHPARYRNPETWHRGYYDFGRDLGVDD